MKRVLLYSLGRDEEKYCWLHWYLNIQELASICEALSQNGLTPSVKDADTSFSSSFHCVSCLTSIFLVLSAFNVSQLTITQSINSHRWQTALEPSSTVSRDKNQEPLTNFLLLPSQSFTAMLSGCGIRYAQ